MTPNEHPFAFAIIGGGHKIVEPTLWELIQTAEMISIHAADVVIYPLYRSQNTEPEVPQNVYAYKGSDGTWQWREPGNIRVLALARYYVPTMDMVQHITDTYPEHFFVYTLGDTPLLRGFDVVVRAGHAYHDLFIVIGILLGQVFPHHTIAYTRVAGNRADYRIAVLSASGQEVKDK